MCTLLVVLMMFMVAQSYTTQSAPVSNQVLHEVLGAFKQAISRDPYGALASWDAFNQSSNPCSGTWTGLQCNYTTTADNAAATNININLRNQSLQGSITPQLSRLSSALVSLDLSYNSFSGTITFLSNFSSSGEALLQNLTLDYNHLIGPFTLPPSCFPHLTLLSIAENKLSGALPSKALSRCPSLLILNVSNNLFTGPLFPSGLGNLTTTIIRLDAGRNNLSGPIPESIGNCSMLTFLSLTYNNFSGALPSSFGLGCPNLQFFTLFYNKLSGNLPLEMGLLSKLSYISIGLNNFSGEVLQTLANCSALSTVDISQMSFTGTMPIDLGSRLPNLSVLNMEMNMFRGKLPESLGNCSHLNYLIVGFNHNISGVIPPTLFQAQHISQLDLQFNLLTGNIPPEIKNLSSLQKSFLNNNKFTGSLPEELGMLGSLQVLTLEHNHFSGSFPNQLFNCSSLMGLSVHDNGLTGSISSAIGRLPDLGSFDASNNKLTGQLPLGLSNCTKLQVFSLRNNALSGEIPTAVIAGLTACSSFDVSYNKLSGPIPDAEFQGKIYLSFLDLSHNTLSGAVPSGLADCISLSSVNLSQNQLSRPIPSTFGESLLNLVELNLSNNSINGSIPTRLSGLQSLQRLDLSYNALSGTIPPALAQVKSLEFLNLSYNGQLEGNVPTEGVFKDLTPNSFLGDPELCGAATGRTCIRKHKRSPSTVRTIAFAAGAACLLLILGFLVIVLPYRQRARKRSAHSNMWDFSPYQRLTLEDIQQATGNFSEDNILGAGATGTVYKGILKDGTTLAFKRFKLDKSSLLSFTTELASVGLIRHRSLAKIMGYCSNQLDTMILILEYMPNGSLEKHLHEGNHEESLSWDVRLQVAVSVAHGLLYLHNYCPAPVIHCDLKPENILFDADMEARIADFGLANMMTFTTTSRFTDNKQGTLGYMAPKLASYGHISRKCDVYSYGVLLMEMITGRKPFEEVQMMHGNSEDIQGPKTLVQWVASMFEAGEIEPILDKELQSRCDTIGGVHEIDQMKRVLDLALQCTRENPRQRPTMQDVVQTLISLTSIASGSSVLKSHILQEILSPKVAKSPQSTSF